MPRKVVSGTINYVQLPANVATLVLSPNNRRCSVTFSASAGASITLGNSPSVGVQLGFEVSQGSSPVRFWEGEYGDLPGRGWWAISGTATFLGFAEGYAEH